jgi:hypothetical protein
VKIRRYFRQPVIQQAVLKLPDLDDIPCEIRNFCQAGLLLKLSETGSEKTLTKEHRHHASVVFVEAKTETAFVLDGRLSHVSAHGVGFVFKLAPPYQVLLALQEKAMPNPWAAAERSAELAGIHEHCVQALEKALRPVVQGLPAQAQIELGKAGPLAPESRNATPTPAPGLIENLFKPHAERFLDQALAQAKSFVVPDLSLQPEAGAIYTDSQIDRQLFEDWMSLIDKVIQLESKYEDVLKMLESRLSQLANRDILNHDNPFGPNVLCHSFHYSLQGLELDNSQRNRVYGIFNHLLDAQLPKLYNDLRILSKSLDSSKPGADKNDVAGNSQLLTAIAVSSPSELSFHAGPGDKALSPASALKPSARLPETPMQTASPARTPPNTKPAPAATPPAPQMTAAPHQPDAFSAFVLLYRYAESQANKNSAEPTGPADRAAIIAALRKLQNDSENLPPSSFNAPWLHLGLNKILAESGQEKVLVTVEVKENLQILGLLVEAMLGDPTLPPCVIPYIRRLQIPLLIASYADPALMHGRSHPGREILNQLDYLTQAANHEGEIDNAELLASLDAIFGRLYGANVPVPPPLGEALDSLQKLTGPLRKAYAARLDRVAESCEGVQRLEHARRLVDEEIDMRIGGKSLNSAILALLDAGWRQLLVLTNLKLGVDNDDWRRQIAVIDLLLAWLSKTPPANPPSPTNIQGLKKYVMEKLPGLGTEPAEINRLLEKIEKQIVSPGSEGSAASFVEIPPVKAAHDQKENALRNRLQGFRTGEWLKFASTRGAWIPLRLAWIGRNPARYVFVNRKGIKTLDLDAVKFTEFLDDKRASRMENLDELTLLERTAKSLLSTLRDRLR